MDKSNKIEIIHQIDSLLMLDQKLKRIDEIIEEKQTKLITKEEMDELNKQLLILKEEVEFLSTSFEQIQ